MKRTFFVFPVLLALSLLCLLITAEAFASPLTQTVRGTVIDADSRLPLIGAQIVIADSSPLRGATTSINGEFRLEQVPLGRIALQVSYLGYETRIVRNIVVDSGKEVVLYVELRESVVLMDQLVVTAGLPKGIAHNEMAIVSARSVSAEETRRHPGSFNDPARILSNFAGVNNSQDGTPDIIVRGNSPKYVQWRLQGVPITSPYHFADQNASGAGGLGALNNNLLATSDFYTGAFSPEYGNVLSGVYDVKMRPGNNERFESVFGFGVLGTDLTLEGPFREGYGGSYLLNYRYSTIAMVDALGIIPDVGGIPKFQDAAFNVVLPGGPLGRFSIFGLAGKSNLNFEDVSPELHRTPGDGSFHPGISEDFNKDSWFMNVGLNHTYMLNRKSYLQSVVSYSHEGIADDVFESRVERTAGNDDAPLIRLSDPGLNFSSRLRKSAYRTGMTWHYKLDARNNFQAGSGYTLFEHVYDQSRLGDDAGERQKLTDFRGHAGTINNFVGWQHRVNPQITIVSGLNNMNVLLNSKSTLEPRIAVQWNVTRSGAIHAGYGLHSTMESIHHYYARIDQEDGSVAEPNSDLGLLKAHHYVLGYEQRLGRNAMIKAEIYYQDLYDLPVENDESSSFATINDGLEFRYADLVNEGTGTNYGVEVTLERFFAGNWYFLINGSLYNSKYTALDGIRRNTRYNGNYLANLLAGKEFNNLGRKNNQVLAVNLKAFYGGGQKIIPLLRDDEGNLAVDPGNNLFWDYARAYEYGLDNVYTVTVSLSYKWNLPKATHELFLDLINLTDHQGRLTEYYDESQPGSIGYTTQPFFFPNLMYRVYF